MSTDFFFRLALIVLLVTFIAHRAYYTRKWGQPEATTLKARPQDGWQMAANLLSLGALLSTALYLVLPLAVQWAALPLPTEARLVGLGLALAGFGVLQWAHNSLSQNWSDAPRLMQHQTLTTHGPYRWVRHPIYTAFLLILSAPLFLSANWLVGGLWIASTFIEVRSRIAFEEQLLAETFGSDYQAYARRTGQLMPRFFSH